MRSRRRSVEERVEAFKRFYRRENERPLLGFFLGSEYPLHRYPSARALPEDRCLMPGDIVPEDYAADSQTLFAQHEACGGDFIWSATAFWGVPWVEAALGCALHADHAAGSIHSEPPVGFRGADDVPEFDVTNPWIVRMTDCFNALASEKEDRFPVGTTRMRGISDLLAALYGNENVIIAMLERPDEVAAVCEKLTEFWISMARLQLEVIPPFHGGIGSFYYSMWCPEGTVWYQEDAVSLLSPDLFERFIAPCARRIAAELPHCILHLHSTGYLPVDAYLEMDFLAIELHIDQGGPSAAQLHDTHVKLLVKKPLLIWGPLSDDDGRAVFGRLPWRGLAVNAAVASPEDAARVWQRTWENDVHAG